MEIDEDIFMCWICKTVHFHSEKCPDCGAVFYHQCTTDLNDKTLKTKKRMS